jgi:hypothetical protein
MDGILVELKLQYLIIKDDHWEASRLNMFFPPQIRAAQDLLLVYHLV